MSYIWYFIGLTVVAFSYLGGGSNETPDCYSSIGPGAYVPCPDTTWVPES